MAQPPAPSITITRRGTKGGDPDRTVLWVRGEHDIATSVALANGISRAADSEEAPLLVDLSEVTFMDASTVGVLVAGRNRLRLQGQTLQVRAPSPKARRILELCSLGQLVEHDPVRDALAAPALASWIDVLLVARAQESEQDSANAPPRDRALVGAGSGVHAARVRAGADRGRS